MYRKIPFKPVLGQNTVLFLWEICFLQYLTSFVREKKNFGIVKHLFEGADTGSSIILECINIDTLRACA